MVIESFKVQDKLFFNISYTLYYVTISFIKAGTSHNKITYTFSYFFLWLEVQAFQTTG